MFITKKKKIQNYLTKKTDSDRCAFDFILFDYLNGTLKNTLISTGIKNTEIHIDWLDNIKCIDIQGKYKKYYLNVQIYPNEFSISFDLVEPDEDITYPLKSKEQLYSVISDTIKTLK